uniref:Endo/exonuclease/phosphatase domain-containing protein n=1 Tax=Caenorhabditis japonica TaxID=281687 RepID=A0A8R1IPH1_CAEJA
MEVDKDNNKRKLDASPTTARKKSKSMSESTKILSKTTTATTDILLNELTKTIDNVSTVDDQSIMTKDGSCSMDELLKIILSLSRKISGLTTLHDTFPDALLSLNDRYYVTRKDRNRHGGGVAILISKKLRFTPVQMPAEFDLIEICAIDVILKDSRVRIIVVYHPNHNSPVDGLLSALEKLLCSSSPCIIVGDFNCPHIDWMQSTGKTVHLLHVQKPLNSGAKPISLVSSMDGFESGLDFAVWGYSTQKIATKNNANLEALKISLKKAWDDLDVNTSRTRRDPELSSRQKVDDLKTVYATYLLLFK